MVAEAKSRQSDTEGFRQIYVPKDSIVTEEYQTGNKKKDEKYFYKAKTPVTDQAPVENKKAAESKPTANKMASLLSALKADDDKMAYNKFIGAGKSEDEEDQDITDVVERRMS